MSQGKHDEWLREQLALHSRLAPTADSLLRNVLRSKKIEFLSVESRVKTQESVYEKIYRKEYNNPKSQLTDLTGIRVIVFFGSQLKEAIDVVKSLFFIDEDNSLNQSELLGSDRIGYRSTHFVCSLGDGRANLPEYKEISDLKFEIQIRTVLQHAWAELAHDRSYKFGPGLPHHIQRELNLYSGLLEIADAAFDRIASQIKNYQIELGGKTADQLYDEPINSLTLSQYSERLAKQFRFEHADIDSTPMAEFLREVDSFGLRKIGDIERLNSKDFVSAYEKVGLNDRFFGLVRDMMMYSDMEKYFDGKPGWRGMDEETLALLGTKYRNQDIQATLAKAGMESDSQEPSG